MKISSKNLNIAPILLYNRILSNNLQKSICHVQTDMASSGLWENFLLTTDDTSMCLTDTGAKGGKFGTSKG